MDFVEVVRDEPAAFTDTSSQSEQGADESFESGTTTLMDYGGNSDIGSPEASDDIACPLPDPNDADNTCSPCAAATSVGPCALDSDVDPPTLSDSDAPCQPDVDQSADSPTWMIDSHHIGDDIDASASNERACTFPCNDDADETYNPCATTPSILPYTVDNDVNPPTLDDTPGQSGQDVVDDSAGSLTSAIDTNQGNGDVVVPVSDDTSRLLQHDPEDACQDPTGDSHASSLADPLQIDQEVDPSTSNDAPTPSIHEAEVSEDKPRVDTTEVNEDPVNDNPISMPLALPTPTKLETTEPPSRDSTAPAHVHSGPAPTTLPIPEEPVTSARPKPKLSTALRGLAGPKSSISLMKSSVPTHLQQEPGGTNGGSEISIQGWHEIYKDKGLLRGFHAKDSNGSDPYVPGQAIFELPDKPSYTLSNKSHRSDEEFISVAYQDGVLHGFSQKDWEMALGASLEAFAIGGISASGGYSGLKTKTNKKSAATNDRIRVISDDVIKASVCLEVSTLNLTKACRDAADTVVQTKTFESVVTFIEQFGVVFATQVVLGGSRFSIAHLTSGSQSDSCQVENKSHVEQQTKVAIPSLMSVNGGFSNDKQNAYSASNVIETSQEIKSWKQIGGLASADVEEWRRSLLQHKYWDVIKRQRLQKVATLVSKYDGLDVFETIHDSVLRQGRPLPLWVEIIPYELSIPELDEKLKPSPLRDFRIGQGIDSSTGQFLKPIEPMPESQQQDLPEHIEWSVYADVPQLTHVLVSSLRHERANFSLVHVPHYLGKIRVSQSPILEQFTVLTRWFSVGNATRPNLASSSDPARLAADTKLDPDRFKAEHGDHFVSAFEQRSVAVVVWVVTCGDQETKERLATWCKTRFDQPASLDENSQFMERLLTGTNERTTASGQAHFYASSAFSKSMTVQDSVPFARASELLRQHSKDDQAILTRVRFEPYVRGNDSTLAVEDHRGPWAEAWKLLYLTRHLAVVLYKVDDTLSSKTINALDEIEKRLLVSQRDALQGRQSLRPLIADITKLQRTLQECFDKKAEMINTENQQAKQQDEDARKQEAAEKERQQTVATEKKGTNCFSACLIM